MWSSGSFYLDEKGTKKEASFGQRACLDNFQITSNQLKQVLPACLGSREEYAHVIFSAATLRARVVGSLLWNNYFDENWKNLKSYLNQLYEPETLSGIIKMLNPSTETITGWQL